MFNNVNYKEFEMAAMPAEAFMGGPQSETIPAGEFRGGPQSESMPAGKFRGGPQNDSESIPEGYIR